MRITIVQTALLWERAQANRDMLTTKLAALQGQTDLVVLPEMFTTGFSMNEGALAEGMDGPTMSWLQSTAAALGAAITGSFICESGGHYFNRLVFMRPDGQFDVYDKKHLFSLAGEHEHFDAGESRIIVTWKDWRICPLICYDLRFPVWSRNTAQEHTQPYDLLLYVANWPNRRAHHWRSLLMARAIENQAFVAGVNVVGQDGTGLEYAGDSAVIDFSGQALAQLPDGKEGIVTLTLSKESLFEYRKMLPFLADADPFQLIV